MSEKDTGAKALATNVQSMPAQSSQQSQPISEFTKNMETRAVLIKKLETLRAKQNRTDDDDLIITGSETKLAQIEQSMGGMLETERSFRFSQAAKSLIGDAIITEECSYVIKFKKEEADGKASYVYTVDRLKAGSRDAQKAEGVTGTKKSYAWNVQGQNEEQGATEIIRYVGACVTILMQNQSPKDVLGIAGRLGWQVAPGLGPITNQMQGKVVKDEKGQDTRIPHILKIPHEGKIAEFQIEPDPEWKPTKLYAHRQALIHLGKNKQAKPVQYAIGYIRTLLHDAMIEDKVTTKDAAKVDVDTIRKYIKDLHKYADKAIAPAL